MRIMLACCAGMSTSLVVSKMEEAAKTQGKDHKIWAVDQTQIEEELGNFDVLLLGPQVRHILRKVTKIVGEKAPIAVIEASAYGRCDGEAVLKQAEELMGGV
jgi:PTS system cellobiose-specific IIB component